MELERQRKMELLHTPKSELGRMMRESSINVEEIIFLFASNKLNAADIRMNASAICDKMLNIYLCQIVGKTETNKTMSPMIV
jgi:hypothetical protein